MTNESKQGAVFVVRLDYLRGKLPQRIYGLMTPIKYVWCSLLPLLLPWAGPLDQGTSWAHPRTSPAQHAGDREESWEDFRFPNPFFILAFHCAEQH